MLIGCCSSILPQVWPKSRSNTQGPRFSLVHSGYNTTSTEFRSCLMEPDVPCARAGFETTVRGNRIRELTNRQPKDERLNPPRQKEPVGHKLASPKLRQTTAKDPCIAYWETFACSLSPCFLCSGPGATAGPSVDDPRSPCAGSAMEGLRWACAKTSLPYTPRKLKGVEKERKNYMYEVYIYIYIRI
ncbi:hypothetical protein SUVC_13G2370 [Saccharomyces uvarum]|uniref:Uncharacterized protein n=1 Tax=Saccharomyces uvarum TaxID=230603 RepID=A0AA35J5F2_SACUV|nr:hypothetical protein SUVC_13G2370 [Saccharomyces uvarum]